MTWATAMGMAGIGATMLIMVIGLLLMTKRAYDHGQDALEARSAQLDAEHFKREAEDQRDAALAAQKQAQGERDAALARLADAQKTLALAQQALAASVKGKIADATDQDLVALSHAVLGGHGVSLPSGSDSGASAAGGGAAASPAVQPPRRADQP